MFRILALEILSPKDGHELLSHIPDDDDDVMNRIALQKQRRYQSVVRVYDDGVEQLLRFYRDIDANRLNRTDEVVSNDYYDLDHWKPKAKYPYLCTSFFNLQPACPSCNRKKSDDVKKEFFQLWDDTGKQDLDVLSVDLTPESVTEYLLDHDASKLDPFLYARKPQYDQMCKDTNEKLHINARYKEYVDVAEEVIWKARAYNASYSKAMRDAFVEDAKTIGLNLSDDELNRFILGTYANPEDIHKRPLTAFMQSIGR